jgi:CheY-like chemotaxis protein
VAFTRKKVLRAGTASALVRQRDHGCRPPSAAQSELAKHVFCGLFSEELQPALVAVLSDINMPGMDGLELLGEIKQRRPDLPVMMVTAYGDDERRRRARELGAVEFITKPVDFDQLKEQLRQLPSAAE